MTGQYAAFVLAVSLSAGNPAQDATSQPPKMDAQVSRLIEQTTHPGTEAKAFEDLEALGCAAVPSIIMRMDDRRSLPNRAISLRNKSPQAFEGVRHYGPEEIVDALAAILNQVTGQDFGFIYNGASSEERTKSVRGWREFLSSTPPSQRCKAS